MLRSQVSKRSVHSSCCRIAADDGRTILYRALMAGALFFCCWIILAAVPVAYAQESGGSITGTVVDPNGAPIQGATVAAKDVERGTVLTTQTNDTGTFVLPRVSLGTYKVTAQAKGFGTAVFPQFTLVLNQTARVAFQMKVGEVTQTIEVTASAPILQTDTTLLGSVVDGAIAKALPLSTHNINQLTLVTTPGVITPNLFGFQAAQNSFGTARPYVNSAREQ